jgi:hypothetical protein
MINDILIIFILYKYVKKWFYFHNKSVSIELYQFSENFEVTI